jgi:hypothetical protein
MKFLKVLLELLDSIVDAILVVAAGGLVALGLITTLAVVFYTPPICQIVAAVLFVVLIASLFCYKRRRKVKA